MVADIAIILRVKGLSLLYLLFDEEWFLIDCQGIGVGVRDVCQLKDIPVGVILRVLRN
jgi:hypothetical protein